MLAKATGATRGQYLLWAKLDDLV